MRKRLYIVFSQLLGLKLAYLCSRRVQVDIIKNVGCMRKLLDYVKICKKKKIVINKNAGFELFRSHDRGGGEISIKYQTSLIYYNNNIIVYSDGAYNIEKLRLKLLRFNVTAALSPSVYYICRIYLMYISNIIRYNQ